VDLGRYSSTVGMRPLCVSCALTRCHDRWPFPSSTTSKIPAPTGTAISLNTRPRNLIFITPISPRDTFRLRTPLHSESSANSLIHIAQLRVSSSTNNDTEITHARKIFNGNFGPDTFRLHHDSANPNCDTSRRHQNPLRVQPSRGSHFHPRRRQALLRNL